ncbi:hypothetical protein Leryth_005899 [Lithospermum erythrorhizon]|nr:hypothetical protein Leryth_005899 [Lithospermum erythrorhizon]
MPAMNGRIFLNRSPPDFDGYGKELKSHGFKFSTDLSLHLELKTESRKKRKIFGVEIAEEVDESTLLSSGANDSYPKSDGGERDTSPFLFGRAFAGSLSKNASLPQGSHGATTPELSWLKLGSCLQNLEFVGGMDARDALKTSVSKSDLFQQSSLCVHPQLNPGFRDGGTASLDISKGKNAFTSLPELFEFQDSSNCWKSVNSTELDRKFLKLDSEITNMSESVSQHFFKITERTHIPSKKSNLEIATTKDAEDKKDDHVNEKRVGFPSTEGISKADAMDLLTDAFSKKGPTQLSANLNVPDNSLGNFITGLHNQIDLNLSIDEAEDPSAAILPSTTVKIIGPEIELEAPALIESEVEHGGSRSLDKSEEPHQFKIKEAAEALVVISSTLISDVASYATCHLENTSNCLHWLADVICSFTSGEDFVIREISQTIDGCDKEAGPKGMDYFEFMTLQLKDVKEETYCYSLSDTEPQKDEETEIFAPKRRSGRRHGRRGRQQKDFQKVLPDLVSLAKQEVVEDLHTLEELFRSTGKTWKSSHSPRINAKKGRQGMKSRKSLHKPEADPARLPSKHKQTGGELQIRGKGFTGWGKRTRRLPRERC